MSNKTKIPFHAESVKFIALSILHFFIFHFIDPFRKQKKGVDIGRFFEGNVPTLIAWLFAYYWAFLIGGSGLLVWAWYDMNAPVFWDMLGSIGSRVAFGIFLYLFALTYPFYGLILLFFALPHRLLVELLKEYKKGSPTYWFFVAIIVCVAWLGLDALLYFFGIIPTETFVYGFFGVHFFCFLLINTVYANWDKKHPIHTPDILLDDNFIP